MRTSSLILVLTFVIVSARFAAQPVAAAPTQPCYVTLPEIDLIVENTRRHIVDWDTFLSLGFTQADIVPCGDAAGDPEGAPITRLLKGSSDKVYWMENGLRRHIPDMDTFTAMGFKVSSITVLPDDVLARWPEGAPMPPVGVPQPGTRPWLVGAYTIQLIDQAHALIGSATISSRSTPTITIEGVESYGTLPVADLTGEGYQNVMFLTRSTVGSHCCWGTTVYQLGATPVKILELTDTAYYYGATGRGEFKDIDGDGVYEFVTHDALDAIGCSEPSVQVVLAYDRTLHRYVGASPRFASFYTPSLAAMTAQAQSSTDWCSAQPLVATLLYLGRSDDARSAFQQFYHDSDADAVWTQLQTAVEHGRSYVAATANG